MAAKRAMKPEKMEVLAVGNRELPNRPCVDCGLFTGCFCDWCYAAERDPDSEWARGHHTPLCTSCDRKYGRCHYCRGMQWAVLAPRK